MTHANATHFVRSATERYGITESDRFSQMFDLTFDLSVFDLFVAWEGGACVCCPTRAALWHPGRFIQEEQLTIWFSVPSTAQLMGRLGTLKPGHYPSLRWSLFCGERLYVETVKAWAAAAPNAVVENLYGPTELTVACTAYRWRGQASELESGSGVVPIGDPLPDMRVLVVDDKLREVSPGQTGELLVAGPQCTPGYWRDEIATARAYITVPGHSGVFYRTGDRVLRPEGTGPLRFIGRADHQVKVRGHRVELGDVESSLLRVPGVASAAALEWTHPTTDVGGIVAFVAGRDLDGGSVRSAVAEMLQDYAVPEAVHVLPELPLNANGKIDRQALARVLQQR